MHQSKICRANTFLCLLLGVASAGATVHIDSTTRNHSISVEAVLLSENNVAKLPILISEKASAETKARADELAADLQKITGAKFEIKTGGQGRGIYVGTIAEFPTPSAVEGLKIYDVYDGKEAFAIRTEGGCVKLLGATDLGVSHAASRFLELLGYRWFFQSPAWEVIPKVAKLTFNLNETDRPEVLARNFGYDMGQQFEKTDPDAGAVLKAWFRRNFVARSFKSNVGHCAHVLVDTFKKEFAAHPEMRALIKDEQGNLIRTGTGPESPPGHLKPGSKSWGMWGQLCVSNPEVQKLGIRYADEYFQKNPDADMVGVGPDDGVGWCLCPECAKLGNHGNQAFYFANVIAKSLQKSHPGKLVGLYAYNWHCDPPDFPLESNVYVELTSSLLTNTKYGFDKLVELWPTKCRYFGIYDYWAVYDWIRDRLPSGRTGNTRYVAEKLPLYIKDGILNLSAESGNSWGSQGVGFYLASRVLWNSSVDTEALKNDFYEKAFGPAAKAMKAYYDHVDIGNKPLVGPTFYRVCIDDLEAADKAATGRPDVLARIAELKQYNVYAYLLGKESDKSLKPEVRKKWALDTMEWNYRIRNTYMTFWTFFAGFTTKQWSKEFNEPTWNWYEMTGNPGGKANLVPYRNLKAIAEDEVERWLQEMKADYGEVTKVTEVSFGKRLVAPEWATGKASEGAYFPNSMQGGYTLAIASIKGEPLQFTVRQSSVYAEVTGGHYVLSDADGKELARGDTQKGENKLELKVPAAGVYYFKYEDSSGGSNVICDKRLRVAMTLIPSRGRGPGCSGNMLTNFYVPKGTTEIQFYARGGGGGVLGLRDPDGHWLASDGAPRAQTTGDTRFFKSDGAYHVIPVQNGMDGKMWALWYSPGEIYFFNIPTILLLSGDGPIVPEEVAKEDGLAILDDKAKVEGGK